MSDPPAPTAATGPPIRVLVLGGTSEASVLARRLVSDGVHRPGDVEVTTSLAGRTTRPAKLPGEVRSGGFGGTAGLVRHLVDERIDLLVDATHPFAAVMRWHAVDAAAEASVPTIRLERAAWRAVDGDDWRDVASLDEAAELASGFRRVFLTTGRLELEPFAASRSTWFLVRSIEPPETMPLRNAKVVLARPPFSVDDELQTLFRHRIDAIVTKNSGGEATASKLAAARQLGIPVVMVERPPPTGGPLVRSVDEAVDWLAEQMSDRTADQDEPTRGV
jgi:precorrin-6A/cobalt-precorrin-6A reductase